CVMNREEATELRARARAIAREANARPLDPAVRRLFQRASRVSAADVRAKIGLATWSEIYEWSRGAVERPDDLLSWAIFGPARDLECQCGLYRGGQHYGLVCESCHTEVLASTLRRWRTGSLRLAAPVVHPFAVPRIALVLGRRRDEIARVIDFELAV